MFCNGQIIRLNNKIEHLPVANYNDFVGVVRENDGCDFVLPEDYQKIIISMIDREYFASPENCNHSSNPIESIKRVIAIMREQLESRKYIPLWTRSNSTIKQVNKEYEEKIKLIEIERRQLKVQLARERVAIKKELREGLEIEYKQFKKEKASFDDKIAKLQSLKIFDLIENLAEPPKY